MGPHCDSVRWASSPGGDSHRGSGAVDRTGTAAIAEQMDAGAVMSRSKVLALDDVEEALACAEQVAMAVLDQAEARVQQDAGPRHGAEDAEATRAQDDVLTEVRERARAEARQIVVEAQQAAAVMLQQARLEADLLQEQAMFVMERVTAMVVDHACEVAESEAIRLHEVAIQDAEEIKTAIIRSARKEAERVRSEAELGALGKR